MLKESSKRMISMEPSLFTDYFLREGLKQTDDYRRLEGDSRVTSCYNEICTLYKKFANAKAPDEADTEDNLIIKVLGLLGFHYLRQKSPGEGGKPDFTLFSSEADKDKFLQAPKEEKPWHLAIAVLEGKHWEKDLDKAERADPTNPESPRAQLLGYLKTANYRSGNKIAWGILSNGRIWRLYYNNHLNRRAYFEIDLDHVYARPKGLDKWMVTPAEEERKEKFKMFYLFFRVQAFIQTEWRTSSTFLEDAINEKVNWQEAVSDSIKQMIFSDAFVRISSGFVEKIKEKNPSVDVELILPRVYDNVVLFLYRLLFLFYAEDRALLPVLEESYKPHSLKKIRKEIAEQIDKGIPFSDVANSIYRKIVDLFGIINKGDMGLNIPPYNGGLFNDEISPLLEEYSLSDNIIAPAIDYISRDYSKKKKKMDINYRDLSVSHLGSIYEGLLEHKLKLALEDLMRIRKDGNDIYLTAKDGVVHVPKGSIYLANDNNERKSTGSYYTPECVIQFIVRSTIEPYILNFQKEFKDQLKILGDDREKTLKEKYESLEKVDVCQKILGLKILDPSMGSGHFLVGAIDYLVDQMVEYLETYSEKAYFDSTTTYISPVAKEIKDIKDHMKKSNEAQRIKTNLAQVDDKVILSRIVAKRCIFGVDINPLAVELAKLSIWLHTFAEGAPLSFLDHHLKRGDSLVGAFSWEYNNRVKGDVVRFSTNSAAAIPRLKAISLDPDISLDQLKDSKQNFRNVESQLDEWKKKFDFYMYERALDIPIKSSPLTFSNLKNPTTEAYKAMDNASSYAKEHNFFHWNLEFPEVWEENPGGFDVIIGNPPYVDIKQLDPAFVNFLFGRFTTTKNRINLYATFIEQSVKNLLRTKGRFGYIIPNSLLYGSSYSTLRKLLLENSTINSIVRPPDNTFKKVKVEPITIILQKTLLSEPPPCIAIIYKAKDKIGIIGQDKGVIKRNLLQTNWDRPPKYNFDLIDDNTRRLLAKIESEASYLCTKDPETTICEVRLGVTPYRESTGHTREQIEKRVFHGNCKKDNSWKPLLHGGGILRYGIFWDGKEYIQVGPHLAACPPERFFTSPRILVRQIPGKSFRIRAGFSDEEYYNEQKAFNLLINPKSDFKLKYVLAILNSKLMSFYHKEKFLDETKTLFQKVLIENASRFPIKKVPAKKQDEIITIVDQLIETVKNYQVEKKTSLKQEYDRLSDMLDHEIYKIYGIKQVDQDYINSKFPPQIDDSELTSQEEEPGVEESEPTLAGERQPASSEDDAE